MAIEIRKLIPDLVEDYVHFFDTTPHDDNVNEHKCYSCVGVTMIIRAKIFQQQQKEENMPFNMLKAIAFKVILLIVVMQSLDGAIPIQNQIV